MTALRRPSPALILAAVALFVALGGPAQAKRLISGKDIRRGTITSKQVKDRGLYERDLSRGTVQALQKTPVDSIGPDELRDGSVGGAELQPGAVGAVALGLNVVVGNTIADGSVGTADLADNAVVSEKIAANTVRRADIGSSAVGQSELGAGSVGSSEVADRSLGLDDLAEFKGSGAFPADAPDLAAGACAAVDSPVAPVPTGTETVLDDVVVAGRVAGWPPALSLRVQPKGDAATVTVIACNTGTAAVAVKGLEFRWAALDA